MAKFPVKFPVSREFLWRRVRSALRRQPGSNSTQDSTAENAESARQTGAISTAWCGTQSINLWLWSRNLKNASACLLSEAKQKLI
jgi:heme-degrading monooxygenase HmoA